MKTYRAVFISPHLDDAVFSCGGTMAQLRREGPVLIINVFTRFPEDVKKLTLSLSEDRHQEEARATELLGCTSISLGETDAFLRRPEYRSFRRLFAPPVPADCADLPRLTAAIASALADVEYTALYAPLGVGWHVDHILCHEAALNLKSKGKLFFYEDAPYCLVPHAVRSRLDEVGRAAGIPERKPFRRECREISRQILNGAMIRNIRPRPLQWVAKPVMGMGLFELLWRHRAGTADRNPGSGSLPVLQPHWQDISVGYALKLQAMQRYESQFPSFFLEAKECEALHRRHAKDMGGNDGLYEMFWEPARPANEAAAAAQDAFV